jgi:hypothetical protein
MIVCPVCEHAQAQGAECEVCGRSFGRAAVRPLVAPLEGMETSRLPAGADVATSPLLGLESTAMAPVDADAPPFPGLERTAAAIPGDGPTPFPAQVVCRYCRTPAAPGQRLCGRCGMRLPVIASAAPAPEAESPRVCSCGTPVSGALCPSCGARLAR